MFLGKLKLKDRPMFRNSTEFDFGHKGLTVIHGLNLNTGSGNNTNAAGKSLLFSTVQDLCYREVLVGSRRDRVTEGTVSLEIGKTKDKLSRIVSKNKKLAILDGSGDLRYREPNEIDAFIKGIIPQSLVAYATLCHIDDRVPHPLIRGETAARREFFTKFFELNSTDNRRKLIADRISEAKSQSKLLESYRSRLAKLTTTIVDLDALKASIDKLAASRARMQTRIDAFGEDAVLRQFLREYAPSLANAPNLKAVRRSIAELETHLEELDVHAEYHADLAAWRKANTSRIAYLSDNDLPAPGDELAELRTQTRAGVRQHELAIEARRDLDSELSDIRAKLATAKDKLSEHSETAEGGACDTCGALLTGSLKRKHEESLTAARDKVQSLISNLKAKGKAANATLALLPDSTENGKALDNLRGTLEKIADAPTEILKPKKPKGLPEALGGVSREDISKKLKALRATLEEYHWASGDTYRKARELDAQGIRERLEEPDPTAAYVKLIDKLAGLNLDYELGKQDAVERAELTENLKRAEEELENAEALEILDKAYSPRGFRRVLINSVCSQLERILNQYAKLIYDEPHVFTLDLDKQFHITVTRSAKGKEESSDVRRLSGAESSMFSILLWLGLMSFVPKKQRPNFLILDELDSRMSEPTTEKFLSFLPRLLTVVDHVIVITPRSEVRYEHTLPDVRYLTVVKTGMSSELHEGSVHQVSQQVRGRAKRKLNVS